MATNDLPLSLRNMIQDSKTYKNTMSFTLNNFTQLENFGHSMHASSYLFRPECTEEIHEVFRLAKKYELTVTARGAGRSYNDAALNGGGIVLDLSRMNHILEWDPTSGLVTCEPGVTLEKLWQRIEPDGWWPPVVSGTMKTTLGGCLGANIHGKNNFRMGTIGEHVVEFKAMLPTGAEVSCSPKLNADLFYSMISGLGMLGIFTSISMQMKRIESGLLEVHAWPVHDLHEHLSFLFDKAPSFDYTVGWMDTMTGGKGLGRGQIHAANYLHGREDPNARETMKLENQVLPPRIFGVFPKSILYIFMKPFANNLGWWGVNVAKYVASLRTHTFRQPHAAFHFLLDYVPNWELSYGRGGLVQYQSFLPKETAEDVWQEMLTLSLKRRMPSYLGVTKRHRPDKFLISHAVDGYSLALDFKVTDNNRASLRQMLKEFDDMVIQGGGRFYFAKNSETSAGHTRAFLGDETIARFKKLKNRCDPDHLLESDLYRRVFG
jgi:decaprenylphospho-beta-D-ribofuranose 2-oxidase